MVSISYVLRSIRPTLPQVITLLLCFVSGLALDHYERLGPTIVVLTIVMGMNLGRTQRYGGTGHRLFSLAALPVVSVACNEVGRLFVQHPNDADSLFTLAIGLSIWMRRFGPWGTRLGTLVALPFIALLVTPVPVAVGTSMSTTSSMLWSALAAVIAYCWVWIVREASERFGLVEPLPRHPRPRREPAGGGGGEGRPRTGLARIPVSSRMALQMTLSLTLAFVIGRTVFGSHWVWIVLTAFIVNSGNRGRGDVVYKSLLRVLGACAGTVVATLLAGALPPRDNLAIVIILIVLAIGSWLRTISYVYWAGCVTSVLSLLQGYFGEGHVGLIGERLLQIVLGGALAALIAWWVLPVRSGDVLRRRLADCLGPLTDLLAALLREPAAAAGRRAEFAENVVLLKQVAPAIAAHRRLHRAVNRLSPRLLPQLLPRLSRADERYPADAVDAVRDCAAAVDSLAEQARVHPESLREGGNAGLIKAVTGNVVAARKAIGRRPDAVCRPLPDEPSAGTAADALRRIDAAARTICAVYDADGADGADSADTKPGADGVPVGNPPARPIKA